MSFLKQHWGPIMSFGGALLYFLLPSLQSFASANPHTAAGVIIGALVTMYYSTSPQSKKQIAALLQTVAAQQNKTGG